MLARVPVFSVWGMTLASTANEQFSDYLSFLLGGVLNTIPLKKDKTSKLKQIFKVNKEALAMQ